MSHDFDETTPIAKAEVDGEPKAETLPAQQQPHRRWLYALLFAALLAVATGLVVAIVVLNQTPLVLSVTEANLLSHLVALESCARPSATTGAPSRDYLSGGYNASAAYVTEQLANVPCDLRTQYFPAVSFWEGSPPSLVLGLAPTPLSLQPGSDFVTMRYGGDGVHSIANAPTFVVSGGDNCNASAYAGMPNGTAAILDISGAAGGAPETAQCPLIAMTLLAQQSGASLVLVIGPSKTSLNGARVRKPGYLEGDELMRIPVFSVRYSLGLLIHSQRPKIAASANLTIFRFTSFNLLCESRASSALPLVAIGAHLDSVPAGQGLNDNGSGSSALLAIARAWGGALNSAKRRVLFAWWGVEEEGLLGSRFFATNVTAMSGIGSYINLDMLGSPNGVRGVNGPGKNNASSAVVHNLLGGYLTSVGLNWTTVSMEAGSDFVAFNEFGIATSGLASGAGGIKSAADRVTFGGLAGAAMDPCYHQGCDTLANVNLTLMLQLTRACFSAAIALADAAA
jgi:hypothetical protein